MCRRDIEEIETEDKLWVIFTELDKGFDRFKDIISWVRKHEKLVNREIRFERNKNRLEYIIVEIIN